MNILDISDEDYLTQMTEAFVGETDPFQQPGRFGDGLDQQESTLWEDMDWWTGEPLQQEKVLSHTRQQGIAEETFAQSTPGSSASFRAAEEASMQSYMKTYRNGRVPIQKALKRGDFVQVGPDQFLRADAGKAFKQARRAAKKDGVNLAVTAGAGNAYRDYATQVRLFREKGDSDTGGLAADPGTSNHGLGIATDITEEGREWMAEHGEKYGFRQLPTESWHFDYVGGGEVNPNKPKPQRAKRDVRLHKTPARQLGVADLTAPSPLADTRSMADAVVGMMSQPTVIRERGTSKPGKLGDLDVDPSDIKSIKQTARRLLAAYGWDTDEDWHAYRLIMEGNGQVSGENTSWNPKAVNPESGAAGLPQRLPSAHPWPNKKAQKAWMGDVLEQLRWQMAYIDDRYHGSVQEAWAFKQANGWY